MESSSQGHAYPRSGSRKRLPHHEVMQLLITSWGCSAGPGPRDHGWRCRGQKAQSLHNSKDRRPTCGLAASSPYTHPGQTQTVSRSWKAARLSPGARRAPAATNLSSLLGTWERHQQNCFPSLMGPKSCNKSCVFFSSFLGGETTIAGTITERYLGVGTKCCFSLALTTTAPGRDY